MTGDARRAAEDAARASYGRLVALLAARSRDIAAAEDALSEAFRAALETWPRRGVPDRPEAWLLTAARRSAGHAWRHARVMEAAGPALAALAEERMDRPPPPLADERLTLLFVCAHPAIDEASRAPLMLQAVLGLDAARIAGAFVVAPAAMAQRLVRAKAKIKDAGLRFEPPDPGSLAERLGAVLQAVYAAYGVGWDDDVGSGLAHEAIFLGRLLVGLLPAEPEARGLLALMLHREARRAARRAGGAFVPLAEQDARLWSRNLIAEAEGQLVAAARQGRPGRFQTEAAIQSLHAARGLAGRRADGPSAASADAALVALYDLLVRLAPSLGARVGRAAALGETHGAAAGLAALDELPPDRVAGYQPFWATRAHLLRQAGRHPEADAARAKALDLTADPTVRAYLERH